MLTFMRRRYTPMDYRRSEVTMGRRGLPDLKLSIVPAGDVVTVTMEGETHFDFSCSDEYIREVLSHKSKAVVVEVSKLTFISSIGMCFLINLRRATREAGGSLKLAGLQPLVRRALEHAHVMHMFETCESAAGAAGGAGKMEDAKAS